MHYEENILVIKDFEDENKFYGTIRDYHLNDKNERIIISYGSTEQEALQKAISKIISKLNHCTNKLYEVGESLCDGNDFFLNGSYFIQSEDIKQPVDFGNEGGLRETFDTLCWHEDSKKWSKFYR